ncbi:hypothetical protein ACSS6W_002708 [Trichoderma asperelloides]
MAHSPSFEGCLERVSTPKRRLVSCVKHRQPAEAWATLILKLSRPGLSFHGAPQNGGLSWARWRYTHIAYLVWCGGGFHCLPARRYGRITGTSTRMQPDSGTQQLTMQESQVPRRRSYGEYEVRKKTRVLLLRTGTRMEPADAGLG